MSRCTSTFPWLQKHDAMQCSLGQKALIQTVDENWTDRLMKISLEKQIHRIALMGQKIQ